MHFQLPQMGKASVATSLGLSPVGIGNEEEARGRQQHEKSQGGNMARHDGATDLFSIFYCTNC